MSVPGPTRRSELAVVALSALAVCLAATLQFWVVLDIEPTLRLYAMPTLVGAAVGVGLSYVLRIRHHERVLRDQVERQSTEVQRLNKALQERVDNRTNELRAREAELLQSQKMEALGRLAGGVAHDFNNLLTGILQGTELIIELADDPESTRELAGEVQTAAQRAAKLTAKLLALSRRRRLPPPPPPTDLAQVVRDLSAIVQRLMGERSVVSIQLAPHTPLILVDPVHLEQVVVNLAVNARDAMPDGGRFSIEVCPVSNTELSVDLSQPSPHGAVRLRITDTGVGIPPELQEQVFEPLFTTKEPGLGTGLGLSIVHSLVHGAGGAVRLESTVDVGTTFELYWPALGPDATAAPTPSTEDTSDSPSAWLGPFTVLLIDDDKSIRRLVARALGARGHTIHAAGDGDEAEMLARRLEDSIDVVLSDIHMPGRTGVELLPLWRELLPGARVVLMTGITDQVLDDARREELGIGPILRKPFDLRELTAAIQQLG